MAKDTRSKSSLTAQGIIEALAKRQSLPDMEDLLAAIVGQFGGFQKFAEEYQKTFAQSHTSPMARSKMLESVMKLIHTVNEGRKQTVLEQIATEDLEALIMDLMTKKAEKDARDAEEKARPAAQESVPAGQASPRRSDAATPETARTAAP